MWPIMYICKYQIIVVDSTIERLNAHQIFTINFICLLIGYNTIAKENLSTRTVSRFPEKHSNWIDSLLLSEDQKTLFSGCNSSVLKQHSVETLQPVGTNYTFGIGQLHGIDLKKNLLAVGGRNKFSLLLLTKKVKQGKYFKWSFSAHIYNMVIWMAHGINHLIVRLKSHNQIIYNCKRLNLCFCGMFQIQLKCNDFQMY